MEVLMLSAELGAGGAPRVIYQVARHLPPEFDTTVAYLGGRDALAGTFERAGFPVVRLAEDPLSVASVRGLRRLLRDRRPDIVHTHMMLAGLLGRPLAARYGIPAIHTVHTNYRMRPPAARYLDALSAPFGRCAVCVSESVEASLPPYYRSETAVVHNCIDAEDVRREGESAWAELDWTAELDPDRPVVANVARYDPKKRRRDLVEAFERVVVDHPDAQLVLTGRRDDRQARLAELARERGVSENVFFVGFVENPQSVYHHADVIALSSESEGFSIGMLEAMAHGRPIVATGIPPFVEALGGDYPGLVPVRSPPALGSTIGDVLADPGLRAELVDVISARIRPFSGTTAANAYAELYRTYGRPDE
jgi:glycosyltransferase involved in cell wall biosynthesis